MAYIKPSNRSQDSANYHIARPSKCQGKDTCRLCWYKSYQEGLRAGERKRATHRIDINRGYGGSLAIYPDIGYTKELGRMYCPYLSLTCSDLETFQGGKKIIFFSTKSSKSQQGKLTFPSCCPSLLKENQFHLHLLLER